MSANQSYIISVSARMGCYRHIRISADALLLDLHNEILEAFDFVDDHAHAFFMNNRIWSNADSYFSKIIEDEERYTSDFKLDNLSLKVGSKFKYVFDFGEEWIFQCKVLHVLEESCGKPVVVRSVGEAPDQYMPDELLGYDSAKGEEQSDSDAGKVVFPKIYSKAKLKKLYAKLTLPEDTVLMLHTYFEAMARLYGAISLRDALKIINSQNDPISEKDFLEFAEIVRHENNCFIIIGDDELFSDVEATAPLDRNIVEESILFVNSYDYEVLISSQEGKPFYIPAKDDLLKYSDQKYYEPTIQSRAMYDYIHLSKGMSASKSKSILLELQLFASIGGNNLDLVFKCMENMGLELIDLEDSNKFLSLYQNLKNNTRIGLNRGHTPKEIFYAMPPEQRVPKKMSFGPNISENLRNGTMDIEDFRKSVMNMDFPNESMRQSMLAELDKIGSSAAPSSVSGGKQQKVGRNDPCLCGSGLKYKKCCGKNQ